MSFLGQLRREAEAGVERARRLLMLLPRGEGRAEELLRALYDAYREHRERVYSMGEEVADAFLHYMAVHCRNHYPPPPMRPVEGPAGRPTLACPVDGCPAISLVEEGSLEEARRAYEAWRRG